MPRRLSAIFMVATVLFFSMATAQADVVFTFEYAGPNATRLTIEGEGTYTGPSIGNGGLAGPTYAVALETAFGDSSLGEFESSIEESYDVTVGGLQMDSYPTTMGQNFIWDRVDFGFINNSGSETGTSVPFTYSATVLFNGIDHSKFNVGSFTTNSVGTWLGNGTFVVIPEPSGFVILSIAAVLSISRRRKLSQATNSRVATTA